MVLKHMSKARARDEARKYANERDAEVTVVQSGIPDTWSVWLPTELSDIDFERLVNSDRDYFTVCPASWEGES